MSVYSVLSSSVPRIACSAFHESPAPGRESGEPSGLKEMHAEIAREWQECEAAYQRLLQESITRESGILRGSLAEFLQTPVRSDNAEVQRIFGESFGRFLDQVVGKHPLGSLVSYEGRIVFPPVKKALDRKLQENGKHCLRDLGLADVSPTLRVFESMFVVEGGMNMDVLEFILRRKSHDLFAWRGEGDAPVRDTASALFTQVHSAGVRPAAGAFAGKTEGVLRFSTGGPEGMHTREILPPLLDRIAAELPPVFVSLWQRRPALGGSSQFVLRIVCDDVAAVSRATEILHDGIEFPSVRKVVIEGGAQLVKELL